jgi:hypothetical protein
MDREVPLVPLVALPDHHHQAPGRAQRPPDVGERGDRVVEEHRAEPADGQVELLRWKAVDLGVGSLEGDVAEPLCLRGLAGTIDHPRGQVDPQRAARGGRARGLPGRLPGPTTDVEDVVVTPDATSPAQHLVVPPQLGVVVDRTRPVCGCVPVPRGRPVNSAGLDRVSVVCLHHA